MLLLSITYLVYKIQEFYPQIIQISSISGFRFIIYLMPVLLLQFINWTLEAIKFKILISKFYYLDLRFSVKAVYAGNFTAFITPERIGNFLGRIFLLKKYKKIIILSTIYGNSLQLLVTVFMAILGLITISFFNFPLGFIRNFESSLITLLYLILFASLTILFFNLNWLTKFKRFKLFRRFSSDISEFISLTTKIKLLVLIVSFLRYFTFSLQFFILSLAFKLDLSFFQVLIFISLLFGVITFLPSFLPGNLITKEALSIFLLGGGLLAIKFSIICFIVWFINVGLSAIIGGFILLNHRKKS